MSSPPRLSDAERRRRIVRRHHLGGTAQSVVEVARALVAIHSSDPLTPHLACRARVRGFTTDALEVELAETRSLRRIHAMRRTMFVVPADEVGVFDAAASRDIAQKERRRVEKWLAAELGDETKARRWLTRTERRLSEVLADGAERRTKELADEVPELGLEVTLGSGKWAQRSSIGARLLFLMAMDGVVVRTRAAGSWRSSQYLWVNNEPTPDPLDAAEARVLLARRYLSTHGPTTFVDLVWWTGWSKGRAKAALDALETQRVQLDGGADGIVLADDVASSGRVAPGVAFLPGLDSTTMGYKERGFYLGDHEAPLFDRNGNAGPTVWVDGRIVGGWAQRDGGRVVYRLLEDIGKRAVTRVAKEAAALQAWFDGVTTKPRFRTPLERELTG